MTSLDFSILGNPISAWIMFLLIILLSFVIRRFISKRMILVILNIVNRTKIEGDFKNKLNKPINNIISILFLYIAFNQLNYPNNWKLVPANEFGLKMILIKGYALALSLLIIQFTLDYCSHGF